ncbi:MAG: carboxypeptidase-like regulatory domain-containing protein [Flammeovirgaceae bacterium]|nr:carboxypeptidase-like regulatory domain-containing protein [Flammeovirgaceae bacterium]
MVEKGTNNPVPFANVMITNTTSGTAASLNGDFTIKIGKRFYGEKLKISCIGFITKTILIDSVIKHTSRVIELSPDIILLDEIIISQAPLDPAEIVKKAIESTQDNYLNTPFNMEFYSEITATEIATNNEFKLETVLFGFSEGYSASKQKQFEILEKRTSGDDHLKTLDYPYWPTFEIHNVDQISSSARQGILNLKQLDKFNLKYLGASIFDTDTVYNIEYNAPKPTKAITGYGIVPKMYKGNIYITTNSHAIVKHEIFTDQFTYMIIYKKLDGKYFPYFISGERSPTGIRMFSKVFNSLTLKYIEIENIKVIDYVTNEFQDINNVKYNEQFWTTNYPRN